MSKPTTRSKNKRHRPDGNEVPSSEILRKFYANKEISQDDINQLYLISKPICQSCRANSKDSSNCFCALIPPPNGSRKSGLWQKISEVVQDLGPDPYQDLRSSVDLPSGLTNLGATCYANSILQCLYMNTSFRAGIFSVEPELLKQQPVLDQLAQLFAQLCSSRLAFVDSAPFIKTLELDNGSQQDSHEFFTLFLSLLEQSLGRSKVAEAKTIVQDLFRGSISHVTRSIDNKSIQCSHGKVPLSKVGSIKRISEIAWHKLLSKYGGGPELSGGDYCIKCLEDVAKTTVSADNYRVRRLSMKEIAEAALTGNCPDENLYYVSRPWLLQWVRRKHIDSPCDADVGPTSSLQCPHGRLMPDVTPAAKRLLVPESLWLFLVESAYAVKPDDALGCLMFPAGSEPCAVCCTELTEIACLEDSQKAAKMQQRQKHEKLFLGRSIGLHPGCRYYLIPSSWLTRWRAYITISGKGISSVEPDNLEVVIDSLKCQKHFKLVERPPELMCKRGVIIQKTSSADGLTIITERDWKLFCEDWNAPEEKGLYAEIEFPSCTSKLGDSSEDMPISDSHLDRSSDAVDTEHESKLSTIKTFPEVCEVCVGERESCELMRKLNYCNEDIRIFLVPSGKEAPRSVVEAASGTLFEPDRRASKRSRRTSGGNSISLRVSGTTSMYQLKMMIWESFGVVKENQKLHKGSREIEGSESTTLADMNILPGDVLWVTDLEIHENRDIADELSNQKMEPQQFEEGFRGTLLTSNVLPQGL
ncbi:ubiquitin carboxyl-terminal hydrolase 26-like isoform X3 [Aristolochia californica]|uniref:ubiquitin carboxyl-terminal hydrolase 26-like isoform X3 n=1 Tax=Aristolochia californica TaxID=171875 RepID=UPI0035DF1E4C